MDLTDEQLKQLANRLVRGAMLPLDFTDEDEARLKAVGEVFRCGECLCWVDDCTGDGVGLCADCLLEDEDAA